MAFQTKKFESIVASMINWVSSNTDKITDFNIGSVVRTILEAVAIELEELYYQLLKGVEEAIEEAIYRTFNFPRNPAQRATGNVLFTRSPASEDLIIISQGSLVSTETEPAIFYEVQAEESLAVVTGVATGGSTTQLIDTTKDFLAEGIVVGSKVKSVTDGGETQIAGVTSITTTTNPYDTLNFATLTNGASFSIYVGKVFYDTGGVITGVSVASGGSGYSVGDVLTLAGGIGGTAIVTAAPGTIVTAVALATGGHSYAIGTKNTTVAPPGGTGCTITINTVGTSAIDYTIEAQLVDSVYFPVGLITGFDYLYIGYDRPFSSFNFMRGSGIQQNIVGVLMGEYWNGTSWQPLTYLTDETKGLANKPFSTNGTISWNIPSNWTRTTYPSTGPSFTLYWMRLKTDTTLTATAQGDATQFSGDVYKAMVMSKLVSVQSQALGTVGNVNANTITKIITTVSGVESVTNPAAFSDGVEEESDNDRKARFALYIQSLARATRGALEYSARTVDQIIAAKAVDDVRATVLKWDDNSATWDDITVPMRVPGDTGVELFPASDNVNNALYFGATEIFNYVNIHLVISGVVAANDLLWEYWDGLAWSTLTVVDGTDPGTGPLQQNGTVSFAPPNDWVAVEIDDFLKMWIRLRITNSGVIFSTRPTGDWCSLPPAFGYVDLYAHDGSGDLNSTLRASVESAVELYRGCGIIVNVKPPEKIIPTITITLLIAENYEPDDIALKVRQHIIDWLNAKVLSEDLYIADLYQLVMNYNDAAILNCTIEECSARTTPTPPIPPIVMDLIVWSAGVVRPNTLAVAPAAQAITVTGVGVD